MSQAFEMPLFAVLAAPTFTNKLYGGLFDSKAFSRFQIVDQSLKRGNVEFCYFSALFADHNRGVAMWMVMGASNKRTERLYSVNAALFDQPF